MKTQHSPTTKTYSLFDNHEEYIAKQHDKWLALISKETDEHRSYLESIGWGDRANYFKVKSFVYQDLIPGTIDISRFKHTMDIPDVVNQFDMHENNTLFFNSESTQEQEIERALDIRLYPTIRRIIKEQGANIFLGSKAELQVYSGSIQEKLIIEIEIPSSVKFYLALNNAGEIKVYISGLVSHENLIQQLITLKLAGIDLQQIPVLGNTQQYKSICKDDLLTFKEQMSSDIALKNVLIVAGCTLENMAIETLQQIFAGEMDQKKFSGKLVSLTYAKSQQAPGLGFIVLNLNYGEICEEQISLILKEFNCLGVFSGSAAGYIPSASEKTLPEIGKRIAIHSARHHSGEVVVFDKENKNLHLQVPTIFVETFDWLQKAKALGANTVDVETFYILRAIQNHQKANPQVKLQTDIGVFISDYVGEKPLRSYKNVFAKYTSQLQDFVKQVLVANITASYNNNRLSTPTFSSEYLSIKPEQIEISEGLKKEVVVQTIGTFWDKSEFSKHVHTPVNIGEVKNKELFNSQVVPRCIHLPIQLPGSDIRIPIEYQGFIDEIQQIFNFESTINPGWKDLYAYLTVDYGFVPKANSQRVPGPHVDGIPGDRENPEKQLTDHSYLVTNAIPTMFYTQQFDMDPYDLKIHHYFAILRALSDESRTITVEPHKIILMDAYSVHTPTVALEDTYRVFIRLEFSTLKFRRLGNTINLHFTEGFPGYPFEYIPCPIPEHLFVPPSVYLNKPITNKDYSHQPINSFGRANLQAIFTTSSRYKLKHSNYKNLNLIADDMMKPDIQGFVVCYQGIPHAFSLYKVENKTVKLTTLFTLEKGKGEEMMIYMMNLLKPISDRLSLQAGLNEGDTPISIVIDDNNEDMLRFFLRAARLAKMPVNIERMDKNLQLKPSL